MTDRLARIDLLRGVAIILVVMHHFWLTAVGIGVQAELVAGAGALNRAFFVPHRLGFLGVKLFFVISGFCIHHSYLGWRRRTPQPTPGGFLLHYLNRRFWRIYPPYVLALLLAFAVVYAPVFDARAWRHLAIHLSLGNTLSPAFFYNINPAFWSVAVEWQLYLIYPIVLWLSLRFGPWPAFLVAAAVALFWSFGLPLLTDRWAVLHLPFRWWFEWSLGFLVAELRARGRAAFPRPVLCAALLVPAAVALQLVHSGAFLQWLMPPLAFAALLEAVCVDPRPLSRIERLVCTIGVSSYSLYLFHNPVIWLARDLSLTFAPQLPPWVVWLPLFLALFVVAQLLSLALFRWVEQPSIQLGQHLERVHFPRWFPSLARPLRTAQP